MSRELLQQALQALESTYDYNDYPGGANCSQFPVIKALREELAKPEPEPAAWGLSENGKITYTSTNQDMIDHAEFGKAIPLYTSPPQQKPLSLDAIEDIWDDLEISTFDNVIQLTRAIEKSHGIT